MAQWLILDRDSRFQNNIDIYTTISILKFITISVWHVIIAFLMARKQTYEELEQHIKELEQETVV